MKDARFTILSTPALLAKVVDMLDAHPDGGPRHQGRPVRIHARQDCHRRAETASSAPLRHIIEADGRDDGPKPGDEFRPGPRQRRLPGGGGRNLQRHHEQEIYANKKTAERFNRDIFHGFDFDSTMLRVGSMNMLLHGGRARPSRIATR